MGAVNGIIENDKVVILKVEAVGIKEDEIKADRANRVVLGNVIVGRIVNDIEEVFFNHVHYFNHVFVVCIKMIKSI